MRLRSRVLVASVLAMLVLGLPGPSAAWRGQGTRPRLLEQLRSWFGHRPAPRARLGVPRSAGRRPSRTAPPIVALLPDGTAVPPGSYMGGFHGTCRITPEEAMRTGLPARGNDWRLRDHVEASGPTSAFRGVTDVVSEPVSGNGAAYWAGCGGWVYEIRGVPSWEVNATLEGRIPTPTGFRGNLMTAEQEIAIPAAVPPERIKAYGLVEEDGSGRLFVRRWIANPGYRELIPPGSR